MQCNNINNFMIQKVNLKRRTADKASVITCLACAGSLLIEFATLSHLTDRMEFYARTLISFSSILILLL
jgi:RNase P subunit RPR2